LHQAFQTLSPDTLLKAEPLPQQQGAFVAQLLQLLLKFQMVLNFLPGVVVA
jgi:hypothetical protein